MDIETAEAVDTLRTDINRVERRVDQVESSLTAKMIELNEDAKRHASVQFESLQHNIQIVAEGLASLSVEIKSRRR